MSSSNVHKKVDKQKTTQVDIQKNEIRITAQGRSRSYISYAVGLLDPSLLQKEEGTEAVVPQTSTQQFDLVVLKAMGKAIQKAVTIAEVLKRRVAGLHQITSIESQEIEDQYEPKEEGMEVVTKKRTVSSIVIKLSKKALDTNALGYQPPIPEDQVTAPQIISAKKVGGVAGAGNEGAGKRRKRRLHNRGRGRGGARGGKAKQEGATTATTATTQQQPATTTTTATQQQTPKDATPVTTTTTPKDATTPQEGGANQRRRRNFRGRGRGRGGVAAGGERGGSRGGNRGRGGRGQPRKPTTQQE